MEASEGDAIFNFPPSHENTLLNNLQHSELFQKKCPKMGFSEVVGAGFRCSWQLLILW